jgi:ankyrin repeat protein
VNVQTPLHTAAFFGHSAFVHAVSSILCSNGKRGLLLLQRLLSTENDKKRTPANVAKCWGKPDTAQLLESISSLVDQALKDNPDGILKLPDFNLK